MSRNGDNSPSMDLNELLRKHEQYKQRQARGAASAPRPQQPAQRQEIKPEPKPIEPAAEAPVYAPPAEEIPVQPVAPATPVEEPIEAVAAEPEDVAAPETVIEPEDVAEPEGDFVSMEFDEEPVDDGSLYEGDDFEDDERDSNPFDSMVSIFRTAWGKIRRKPKDSEDDLDDEAFSESGDVPQDEVFDETAGENDFADDLEDLEADEPPKKRKGLFGWKKKRDAEPEDDFIFDDSDYADDDYVAEEFPDAAADGEPSEAAEPSEIIPEGADEEPAPVEAAPAADVEDFEPIEDVAPAADVENFEPIEDVAEPTELVDLSDDLEDDFEDEEEAPKEKKRFSLFGRKSRDAQDEDDDENSDEVDNDPDEDDGLAEDSIDFDDDEDDADDDAPKKSAFKRFLNLFIVREDDEDSKDKSSEDDGWDDDNWLDDFTADGDSLNFNETKSPTIASEAARTTVYKAAVSADLKGGTDMDEKNRVNTDMTELLAAGLETQGMSRRERRELAAKQAAEAAAKAAAEEAAKRAAEEAAARFAAPIVTPTVEEPAASESASTASELAAPDEPTRIFKPITTLSGARPTETPVASIPGFDDEEDEEDDEEEEIVEKRRPFGLFHKKRARDEEDEDEDDDEYEDEEDEDEEDEEPRAKKSRGLFGKKSRAVKYDEDDEDEDDLDDEEDEDEDEYDEYDDFDEDDDYDDEDYDDEEDDGRPLGLRILGFFKGLFAFVLCILVVICALNFLDYFNVFSLDSVFEHHYNKAPAVFDTLFPSHNLKRLATPEESITAIDPIDAQATPEATDAPVATEAPVVTEAPVATEVPTATEAPAVG